MTVIYSAVFSLLSVAAIGIVIVLICLRRLRRGSVAATMNVVVSLCETTLAEVRQCKHLGNEAVNMYGDYHGETAV